MSEGVHINKYNFLVHLADCKDEDDTLKNSRSVVTAGINVHLGR